MAKAEAMAAVVPKKIATITTATTLASGLTKAAPVATAVKIAIAAPIEFSELHRQFHLSLPL